MQDTKKTFWDIANSWGKLLLLCLIPAIFLKFNQRIKHYMRFYSQGIKSPIDLPLLKRLWAMKHGFYVESVVLYGLNKNNIKKYMPDFVHDSLHPINGRFSSRIDDKLQLPFLLKDFSEYVPAYYYLIYDSQIIELDPASRRTEAYAPAKLLSFLQEEKKLILKPLAEDGGSGVFVIETDTESYRINGMRCSESDVFQRLCNLEDYIVCQFVEQHPYANELYASTTNTIRLITMRDYEEHKAFIGAYFHRIGTHKSIPVDNFAQGGLLCSIDWKSGMIGHGMPKDAGFKRQFVDTHPDTGTPISGIKIPNWEYVKSEVLRMADHFAYIPYMGWDILVTNDGFKVLEINSLPSTLWQIHNPIDGNLRAKKFYNYILRKKGFSLHL